MRIRSVVILPSSSSTEAFSPVPPMSMARGLSAAAAVGVGALRGARGVVREAGLVFMGSVDSRRTVAALPGNRKLRLPPRWKRSGEELLHHVAVDVREPEITARMAVGELLVIEP